jgi:pSer/pThr/pTyr-binding forkhead associated (FHA) protein
MAVRFEVLDDSGEPREDKCLVLDGTRILIGRGPACDVRLPEVSVSLRHASVEVSGGRVQVRDERSTNGTMLGRDRVRPVAPMTLDKTSVIRVGRVRLRVTIGTFAPETEPSISARQIAYGLVAEALEERGLDATPVMRCVAGEDEGATLRLAEEGRAYRVGREDHVDLVLTDNDVSRDHAQLTLRGGVVLLRDLNSKNGTLLGEVELSSKRDVPWKLGATLTIGHDEFLLDDPLGKALAAIEAEPDAIVPDEADSDNAGSESHADNEAPTPKPAPKRRAPERVSTSMQSADIAPTRAELAILVTSLVVLALSAVGLVLVLRR